MFVHLHGHSTFSFLEAIGKPNKIAARAKELGMSAIAITDYNGMHGTIKFLQSAKDEGIKPILGAELGFVLDIGSVIPADQIGTLVVLAKATEGYQHLMEVVSFANTKGIHGKPKIDISVLKQYGAGLVTFFGGTQSWIGKMVLRDDKQEKIIEIIKMIQDIMGKEHVYGEIIAQKHTDLHELERVNTAVLQICTQLGIPCLVNSNYHYIKKDDKPAWEVALAIKDAKKIYDQDRRKPKGDRYIMTEVEIRNVLEENGYAAEQIDQWITNNISLADSIDVKVKLNQTLFPNYDSPEDIIEIYEGIKDTLIENE